MMKYLLDKRQRNLTKSIGCAQLNGVCTFYLNNKFLKWAVEGGRGVKPVSAENGSQLIQLRNKSSSTKSVSKPLNKSFWAGVG